MLLGLRAAQASTPVGEEEIDRALAKVALHRHATTISEVRLLATVGALAPMDDSSSCPNIDFDVVNASKEAMWNIVAEIDQQVDYGDKATSTLHVPYLAARAKTQVRFHCGPGVVDYGGYGVSHTRTIGFAGLFHGSRLNLETVRAMLAEKRDFMGDTSERFEEGTSEGETVVRAALRLIDDERDRSKLAGLLVTLPEGARQLAAYLARFPEHAAGVLPLVKKASAASQGAFVEGMLASQGLTNVIEDGVLPALLDGQCGKARANAQRLWLQAMKNDIPDEGARRLTLQKCAPRRGELTAWMAHVGGSPVNAAVALDAVDADSFAAGLKIVAAGREGAAALGALVARTEDGARLDAAASALLALGPAQVGPALFWLVKAHESPLVARKLEVLRALLEQSPADARAGFEVELFQSLLAGEVVSADFQKEVKARRAWAGPEIDRLLAERVRAESQMFDAEKILAAGDKIDLADFLLVNKTLAKCDASKESLQRCLEIVSDKLAALPAGALVLTGTFGSSALSKLGELYVAGAETLALLKGYRRYGLDTRPVVNRLCTEARGDRLITQSRLATASAIDPDAPCIKAVERDWAARERRAMWSRILRGSALLLPLGLGFLFFRWRLRKYAAGKPAEAASGTEAASALAGRLTGPSWRASLEAGLAQAQKTFAADKRPEAAEAARLIAALGPEQRDFIFTRGKDCAQTALETGEVKSFLVQGAGAAVYVVLVPGRADQPQTLRRHAAFVNGWLAHAGKLARAVRAGGSELPVLALVVFLRSDASQGTLLVALDGARHSFAPAALLDDREARSGALVHQCRYPFSLEHAAGAEPPRSQA